MSDAENPSWKNEESQAPYNEEKARKDFGEEFVERLKKNQEEFRGDWWQLAMLIRNLEDDAKPPPDESTIKPEERLRVRDWNAWHGRPQGDRRFEFVHLEHANLAAARLEYANLSEAHLEHANLPAAHLEHAYLINAHLDHAEFVNAHLEHTNLGGAHLEHANLPAAHLDHADLIYAHLDHADLGAARFGDAWLYRADLSESNVRGARGLLFDDNRVRDLDIEGDAPDPWSVLRRKYTGPWFFVHLLLLMVFFAPYLGRAAYLSATRNMEQWTIEKYAALGERLEEAPGAVRELSRAHAELKRRFDETHEERRAVWVLLGDKVGWGWALPMVVIVYNFLRGYLTLRVSMLRDAEEHSQHSPALEEYYGMWHPLRESSLPKSRRKRWRGWLGGWLGAIGAFFTGRPGWEHCERVYEWAWSWRVWSFLSVWWRWVSEAPLRFGLHRMHRIARLMFIAVVLVVAWHTWDWMRNTWVLVPKA